MRFVVSHQTLYRYSVPAVLGPHVLRLTPRRGHALHTRSLVIGPEPSGVREVEDAHGNAITEVTFPAWPTSELRVESRFDLDTRAPAEPDASSLAPLPWSQSPGAAPEDRLPAAPPVADFARALAAEVGHQPLTFLDHLCRTIHGRADNRLRAEGDARTAADTLASWQGACRDFTVLFMAAARSQGIPARFCSGYHANPGPPDPHPSLHAWPEVFLPGAGWRGWDPTNAVRAGEGHVPLCAAPEQSGTMPISGTYTFEGPTLTTTLDFALKITTS